MSTIRQVIDIARTANAPVRLVIRIVRDDIRTVLRVNGTHQPVIGRIPRMSGNNKVIQGSSHKRLCVRLTLQIRSGQVLIEEDVIHAPVFCIWMLGWPHTRNE
jgi:hypothetical protein